MSTTNSRHICPALFTITFTLESSNSVTHHLFCLLFLCLYNGVFNACNVTVIFSSQQSHYPWRYVIQFPYLGRSMIQIASLGRSVINFPHLGRSVIQSHHLMRSVIQTHYLGRSVIVSSLGEICDSNLLSGEICDLDSFPKEESPSGARQEFYCMYEYIRTPQCVYVCVSNVF